jgi:cell division transport system permease protein
VTQARPGLRRRHQQRFDFDPFSLPARLQAHLIRHVQVALFSLGRLCRSPIPSLMTATVLGIALALPSGLYLLLSNLQRLGETWDGSSTLSVFLHTTVALKEAGALAARLEDWPEIAELRHITPAAAMEEFARLSGFGEALKALAYNPLPNVLVIKPATAHNNPEAAERLLAKLRSLPETEQAQLDLQWVRRFAAMLEIARRGILVVATLLGLAVLLIVGNTIRLEIQNRREEIEVTKLIGATDAFIRRPFLYSGVWYGAASALTGWLLVESGFWLLTGPVKHLAGLYASAYTLQTQPLWLLGALLLAGASLGLLGSWIAVSRHLGEIEPA